MIAEAGLREDGFHVLPMRVYFEDTDAAGVVYYANYLKFAERGRTEMPRSVGLDHQRLMQDDGVAFAVSRCEIDYLSPAVLDDRLEVHTGNIEMERASLWAEQVIKRGEDAVVQMRVRLVCLARSGRPARLPGTFRAALQPLSRPGDRDQSKPARV